MKTFTQLLLVWFCLYGLTTKAQTVNIPDANFKYTLLNQDIFVRPPIDTNQDGEIQYSEAAAVDTLIVGDPQASFNIQDLTGIEAFVNLKYLDCQNNQLTSLDLSQNTNLKELYCFDNQITNIVLYQNSQLRKLYCGNNQLTSLNISQYMELTDLVCSNNSISNLDISQNTELEKIACVNNQLNSLNLKNGNNTDLVYLYAENNPDLSCIYVDDKNYSQNNAEWHKDPSAHYVETQSECESFGVNNYDLQHLKIYPNPVRDKLHIKEKRPLNNIRLFDLQGKRLYSKGSSQNKQTIDLSSFPSGIYFLKITLQHHRTLTTKIVKL